MNVRHEFEVNERKLGNVLCDRKSTNILHFAHVPLSKLGTVHNRQSKKRDVTLFSVFSNPVMKLCGLIFLATGSQTI